ncbi:MAG: hypothetical protein JXJ04_26955 [Spirochaetales bacterium]|nr:hypothetical protein [Spirochaetales bacterium]
MHRIEIIANKSIEGDMFDLFKRKNIVNHYTKIPSVYGVGTSGPRMGDHIWPEENFVLIIYCSAEEADAIKVVITDLKRLFKQEGIKLFEIISEV